MRQAPLAVVNSHHYLPLQLSDYGLDTGYVSSYARGASATPPGCLWCFLVHMRTVICASVC
jgi:hypothetical protein